MHHDVPVLLTWLICRLHKTVFPMNVSIQRCYVNVLIPGNVLCLLRSAYENEYAN